MHNTTNRWAGLGNADFYQCTEAHTHIEIQMAVRVCDVIRVGHDPCSCAPSSESHKSIGEMFFLGVLHDFNTALRGGAHHFRGRDAPLYLPPNLRSEVF